MNFSDYQRIKLTIGLLSNEISEFSVDVTRPYSKEPSYKFIFVDVDPQHILKEIINSISLK
jgi:hypothetical protein